MPNGVAHEYEPDEPLHNETEADELLEAAWNIIANAGQGFWPREGGRWMDAASRWRDRYHAYLDTKK